MELRQLEAVLQGPPMGSVGQKHSQPIAHCCFRKAKKVRFKILKKTADLDRRADPGSDPGYRKEVAVPLRQRRSQTHTDWSVPRGRLEGREEDSGRIPAWTGLDLALLLLLLLEVGLLLPDVPVQALREALKPVAHGVPHADGGERVA